MAAPQSMEPAPISAALKSAMEPFHATRPFLRDALGGRALEMAFSRGIIDSLASAQCRSVADLGAASALPAGGLHLLLSLLEGAGVVEAAGHALVRLSAAFRAALPHRDLMDAKLAFAAEVAPDFHRYLDALLSDRDGFMGQADVFGLFRYDLAMDDTPEHLAATARWVALTTGLARHEGPVLAAAEDFSPCRRLLDVGGNSGETARILCASHPGMSVVVADLPAVCAYGSAYLRGRPEAARITFRPLDLRHEDPPGRFDAVLLKSVLHDWPDSWATLILRRAAAALGLGGRLVVFERLPLDATPAGIGYGTLPDVVFHHFYRGPGLYLDVLRERGLAVRRLVRIDLDVPFMLLTAERVP